MLINSVFVCVGVQSDSLSVEVSEKKEGKTTPSRVLRITQYVHDYVLYNTYLFIRSVPICILAITKEVMVIGKCYYFL